MKNFYVMCLLLIGISVNSQTKLDSMLVNVNKSSVTSGIIYERVTQFANLYNFNSDTSLNNADYSFVRQALSELHRASNQNRLISLQELENRIALTTQADQSDIAIINTPYQILNYNFETPSAGGLTLNETTQTFSQISNKAPFFNLQTTIVAPTKNIIVGSAATFKFSNNLYLVNGGKQIKKLTLNFGSVTKTIINNMVFLPQTVTVPYYLSGTKEFTCTITYTNNQTLTTKGSFYFHYKSNALARNGLCVSSEERAKDFTVIAEESFKGYEPNDPRIFPQIEYRVFYAVPSYHADLKVHNPVIIIDGFDPGDKRKIQDCDCEEDPKCASNALSNGVFDPDKHDSMEDFQQYQDGFETINVLNNLRLAGYDVILVNQPTYTTTKIDNGQQVKIDGGAYYIESNALALVKLIKDLKVEMTSVSSTQQISIVGPSMGGQISRYALAYMEKKYAETNEAEWQHNAGLWISVDSPHLGANIPMGDQALLYLADKVGGNDTAGDRYKNQLGSVAAKQQLIELHRDFSPLIFNSGIVNTDNLNGRVVSQGYTSDDGSSYYRTYYNAQENNGLSGSHGYPQNLRKIALINGSMTGKTIGDDSELVLNIRGFLTICVAFYCFDVHIASLESNFMPNNTAGTKKIARLKAGFRDAKHYSPNINSRGNMDIVPGGLYDAQKEIADGVLEGRPISWLANNHWELREYNPIHSFIPSFSAIAHKHPNQGWETPLNYNLVCADDTYFDSYWGGDENTKHTSFTKESAEWLFKELAGDEQIPYYPLDVDDMNGEDVICVGDVKNYSFGACKLPSIPTWSVGGSLELVSVNNNVNGITVRALSNGNGIIRMDLADGRIITKDVHVGTAQLGFIQEVSPISTGLTDPIAAITNCDDIGIKLNFSPSNAGVLEVAWKKIGNNYEWTKNGLYAIITPDCNDPIEFQVKVRNKCGWSSWQSVIYQVDLCVGSCTTQPGGTINSTNFTIYPVPADTVLNIKLKNDPIGLLQVGETLNIKLMTTLGLILVNMNAIATQTAINVASYSPGVYTLILTYNGQPESHQIIIN